MNSHQKYLSFKNLYAKCAMVSLPVISVGAYIMAFVLQLDMIQDGKFIYSLTSGLTLSVIFYPLFFANKRRRGFQLIDVFMMILSSTGLATINDGDSIFYIFIFIGIFSGCSWASASGYVSEVAGWEDSNSAHINNIPITQLILGAVIIGVIRLQTDLNLIQISYGINLVLSFIRFMWLWCFQNEETPVFHMSRFEELRGRLLLQKIYQEQYVENYEYTHILNNEKRNPVNRSMFALFKQPYLSRMMSSIIMNLLLWWSIQLEPIGNSNLGTIIDDQTQKWEWFVYLGSILILCAMGSIGLTIMKTKISLIIGISLILFFNIWQFIVLDEDQYKFNSYLILIPKIAQKIVFFLFILPKQQMQTFQILPDKGWAISTNVQWIGLSILIWSSNQLSKQEDIKYIFFTFPLVNFLQLVILCTLCYEYQGLNEEEIQQFYLKE